MNDEERSGICITNNKKMLNIIFRATLIFILVFIYCINLHAQEVKNQNVRGYVVDRATGNGIAYAYVEVLNYHPSITCVSKEDGSFELPNVPVGHQRIRVIVEGFYEAVYPEFIVAGKQSVLTIGMEEELKMPLAVVEETAIKRKKQARFRNSKMEAIDEMNAVSSITVNIDETKKFVSGFGDPARAVTNFPGMFNVDDAQNFIVSRGNSPYGIQWMIEGVPVDNPHHFAVTGNTGGIFPLLNNSLLANSDFVNGALAAQYSNVYSGVFDVKLRRGNNEQHEFSAQVSTFGTEVTAEGPIKKGGASFIVAGRVGIFDLLQLAGIDVSTSAVPRYYDLNFKFDIPTQKLGHFSIFGIGGMSDISFLDAIRDTSDIFAEQGVDLYVKANMGILGVKHLKHFNKQISLKTTLSYQVKDFNSYRDTIYKDRKEGFYAQKRYYDRIGLSTIYNQKISNKLLFRGGLQGIITFYQFWDRYLQRDETTALAEGVQGLFSGFAQAQYKFSRRFVLTLGVQGMYWTLNKNSWSVEPRVALNWYIARRHTLSLGYGWHSKIQNPYISFFVKKQEDGTYDQSNRELGPTRSHHLVLTYNTYLGKYWSLKANVYGQYNTNIAVLKRPSSISMVNQGIVDIPEGLIGWENTGEGYNYGAELGLEKFFHQGYYGLLSAAYQRAFYRGSDLIWRNSAFDVQYVGAFVAGKEFKIGQKKRNVFYADLRFNLHGGLPYTPVDIGASKAANREILLEDQAYTKRLGMYKRIDVRVGARFNHRRKRISHHIYVEVLNVAAFKNDLQVKYNVQTEELERAKQFGLLPNIFYQVQF